MKKFLAIVLTLCLGLLSMGALPASAADYVNSNTVDFFLQLEGCQMDTDGNIAPRPKSLFTQSVNTGELIEGNRTSDYTVVLGGDVSVDDVIAEVVDKPTDDEVFAVAKQQLMQIGYIRSSNGEIIPWSKLTSENYRAEWYVLKYEQNDDWHIDGRIIDKATDHVIEIIIPDDPDDIPKEPDVPLPEGEEIDLSGVKYAYIFGYEPIIKVEKVTDENGNIITNVSAEIHMAPEDPVTREQTSAMIMRMIDQTFNTMDEDYPVTPNIAQHKGAWYERGLAYLSSKGAFDDVDSVRTGPITRGEVAKLIAFGLNLTKSTDVTFEDVSNTKYLPYIKIMRAYGYMEGTSDTTFEPDRVMTRAEFCMLFNNIIDRNSMGLIARDGTEVTAETYYFVDMDPKHWAYEVCLKASSAYDEDGYVDLETRLSNIRNKLDKFDSQMKY